MKDADENDKAYLDKDVEGEEQLTILDSLKRIAKESFPIITSSIFFQLVGQMNIIFVGQSDDPMLLAGVGMGSMLINIFVFATSQGLAGTIETFVGRDFGAGNLAMQSGNEGLASRKFKECGIHLNRAKVIITLVLLPIFVAFFWADTILIKLQQDAVISTMARNYVMIALPGVFALTQFDCRRRWL